MNDRELLQAGYGYALALGSVPDKAADLVQEAWLRLFRRNGCRRYKPLSFTAIRNLYIDQYRHERTLRFVALDQIPDMADPDAPLPSDITADDLAGPLAELRVEEREALFLSAVEGCTAREIGKLTERSKGTALSSDTRLTDRLAGIGATQQQHEGLAIRTWASGEVFFSLAGPADGVVP